MRNSDTTPANLTGTTPRAPQRARLNHPVKLTGRLLTGRLRKAILALLLCVSFAQLGCVVPIYDSSRDRRARQLIYVSESMRHIPLIWERIWFLDQPDLMTPFRTHGGII